MEHKNLTSVIMAIVMIIVTAAGLTACSKEFKDFSFETTQQAVNACHKELAAIRPLKKATIEELSVIADRWIALQDTTFSVMVRDSTIDSSSEIAVDFFAVSDSIRSEIMRLALDEPRTMKDVIYFKVHTARNRDNVQSSKDYKSAVAFYNDLDGAATYKNAEESVKNYKTLLQKNTSFKKEGELLKFISEEDRCFRSLMEHLHNVKQEDLETLASQTAQIFQKLYKSTQVNPDNPVSSRLITYISMRFNRRIIQNAEAVMRDCKSGKVLTEQQATNYRWMLLQPYLSIDAYSMASVTDEQAESLQKMAEELPRTLAYIDGKDFDKSDKSETENLPDILTRYFLKSYLRQAL